MNVLKAVFGIDFTLAEGGASRFHHNCLPGGLALVSATQKAMLELHLRTASMAAALVGPLIFLTVVLGILANNGWLVLPVLLLTGGLGFWHVHAIHRIVLRSRDIATVLPESDIPVSIATTPSPRKVLLGLVVCNVVLAVMSGGLVLLSDRSFYVVVGAIGCGIATLLALVFIGVWIKAPRPA